jgi:hypothetical protein
MGLKCARGGSAKVGRGELELVGQASARLHERGSRCTRFKSVQQNMNLQSMLELRWPQHTCSAFGFASSTHGHHGYEDTLAHPTLSEGCDGIAAGTKVGDRLRYLLRAVSHRAIAKQCIFPDLKVTFVATFHPDIGRGVVGGQLALLVGVGDDMDSEPPLNPQVG